MATSLIRTRHATLITPWNAKICQLKVGWDRSWEREKNGVNSIKWG